MINVTMPITLLLPIVAIGTFTSSLPLYTVSRQCSKRSWITGGFELRPLIVVAMMSDDMLALVNNNSIADQLYRS
jgi:hypothetical protein